jgi:hypothetical protein
MTEVDELARRAVDGVIRLAARATRFASYMFVAVVLIGTTSFLLGLAALDGSARTVWIVLGLGFGAVAVRNAFVTRWRLASVGYHVNALVAELVSLLEFGHPATRTMVDAVEADEREGDGSVLVVSREFYSLRDTIENRASDYRWLMAMLRAVTTFPALVVSTIAITVVFAMFVPIFLIVLAA